MPEFDPTASPPPCRIMTLPDELLIQAARIAVEIDPRNAPASQQAATVLPFDTRDILNPQSIAALTSKTWGARPRVLSVSFLDGGPTGLKSRILSHMNAWDCGITFALTDGQGEVRITRSGSGYWSYLGTDILSVSPGQPTMNLQGFTESTSEAEYRRVVRHETGHTLSFPHEHLRRTFVDRIDRQRAYAYFWEWQRWSPSEVDNNVLTPVEESALIPGDPESTSIMTYPLPGAIMVDGIAIPGGMDLTAKDLAFVDRIYPVPGNPIPPLPPTNPDPGYSGPFDLIMGRVSREYRMQSGAPILFRFTPKGQKLFAMQTGGDLILHMELLDAAKNPLAKDEHQSGLEGNAAIVRAMSPGTYFLKIKGYDSSQSGPFRVKVGAVA